MPESARTDDLGMTHRRYRQQVDGVEVYGGVLDVHVARSGEVRSANARIVPGISVDTRARVTAERAGRIAVDAVLAEPPGSEEKGGGATVVGPALEAATTKLWIYDDGLVRGRRGTAHLAWLVEVRGPGVREWVFVDAHAGKVVERWSGVHDALFRRLHVGSTATAPIWDETRPFPGALDGDKQRLMTSTEDTWRFFANVFGRDSWDGAGAEMPVVESPVIGRCPNAWWDGEATNFCLGLGSDDVVAHEWAHAYAERVNPLVYLYQSGALNESYSDVWGETIDLLNGMASDFPDEPRTAGACSVYMASTRPAEVVVTAPAGIAGAYVAGRAVFGPSLDASGLPGVIAAALDGVGTTTDACEAIANGAQVSGRIALVDRGSCSFTTKVRHAQDAGAIAVVVADNDPDSVPGVGMGGSDPSIVIPSVLVPLATGTTLRTALASGAVSAVLRRDPSDVSLRWLFGEDAGGVGGAFRDLWSPGCGGDPGSVGDPLYHCSEDDAGGVHVNSGVPNHAFTLLVDGGTFGGRTVPAIGLVKAVHLHWRAQTTYETETSGFADHADALEAACDDLLGVPLAGLGTTAIPPAPSGEAMSSDDCDAVSEAIAAVEMRRDPVERCGGNRLLSPDVPARCGGTGVSSTEIGGDDFESADPGWTFDGVGRWSGWPGLSFEVAADPPDARGGKALFVADPAGGDCGRGAGDWSGVARATSPPIAIPTGLLAMPRIEFAHWVATQPRRDGGQVEISVNGGPFAFVPAEAFLFNPYNDLISKPNFIPFNDSPMAGEPAFTGSDTGSARGSWGRSTVDLGLLGVGPGDVVRVRFAMGFDGCLGREGWWIDDVSVHACESVGSGALAISQAALSPGASGKASASIKATIATGATPSDVIDAASSYRFDLAATGVSESAGVLASECRANRAGTRITCRGADRRARALFSRPSADVPWRLSLTLKGLSFAPGPQAPVSLAVSRSGRAWTGSASSCVASATGKLVCRGSSPRRADATRQSARPVPGSRSSLIPEPARA
ncbi:MAG: M4 family metallopeptidase [Alphaproteobacteria bacterium]